MLKITDNFKAIFSVENYFFRQISLHNFINVVVILLLAPSLQIFPVALIVKSLLNFITPVYQIILVHKHCCNNLLYLTTVGCAVLVPVSISRVFYKYVSVVETVVFYDIVSAVLLLNT
jgi:hypothetical protein